MTLTPANMVQASQDALQVTQDLPQAIKLMQEMGDNIQQVTKLVDSMLARVKRGEISTAKVGVVAKGLSFLEVKYHTLLGYLINLTYVVLRKCSGRSIEDDPAIERLVELRTVLEKIRPIDRRLKYQIDKLLDEVSSEEEEEDEEEGGKKSKKNGDETPMSRQEKMMERARRRALNSSLVRELREEYMDVPTEMGANLDGITAGPGPLTLSRQQRERQEYEEMYFTRLPESKEQKRRSRKLPTIGSLGDELTNFGDSMDVLEGRGAGTSGKRKHSQSKSKKGKGKKVSKKRKFH
ncbi:hypothetical protein B566_EDAN005265 [Ephemera danica]|nr:hypothetical protein B566_EDAN005265 [Ephemera danica]